MSSASSPLVLVADDEPSMLELVARHLKTMSDPRVEVIEASDGEQAWRLAREHLPDLVVLDVMMPGMSGWEVCRKIREDVALAHTGVVMLTGIGENLNQLTSPLYGADAYIDKPFDFGELDRKVRTALEARAGQREGVVRPRMNGVGGAAKPAKNVSARIGRKAKGSKPEVVKAKVKAKAAPAKKKAPAKVKAKAVPAKKKPVAAKKPAKLIKTKPAKAAKKGTPKNGVAKRPVAAKAAKRTPPKAKRPAARKSTSRRATR
jgi:DNA-binding response OmpR family regulator